MADEVTIVVRAVDSFSATLGDFGNIMTGIKSAVDLAGQAFNAAYDFVSDFVGEAAGAELAMADLEAVVKSTGGAAGYTAQELMDMSGQLQNVTRFSDETIAKGEGMLATFTNIGHDVFPLATQAMVDMGEKFGGINSAAVQLGKALNDPINGITALTRVGVSFTDEQKEQIKTLQESGDMMGAQKIILAELSKEFGGAAEAAGQTFAGQIDIAKNKISDMKEMIGGIFLPVLKDLLTGFNEFASSPSVQNFLKDISTSIANGDFSAAFQAIDKFMADIFQRMTSAVLAWIMNGGPEELTNKIVSFLDGIANGDGTDSKALQMMQRLLAAITMAVDKVDWSAIMKSLDDAMGRAISSHDWTASGASFGEMIDGIFSGQISAQGSNSSTIAALGKALGDWFRGAVGDVYFEHSIGDLAKAAWQVFTTELSNWFNSTSLGKFLNMPIADSQAQMAAWFKSIGQSAIDGFVNGINSIALDIDGWLRAHVVEPFKDFLGISSPSTLFSGFGRDIVQGLINGIDSLIDTVIGVFKNMIYSILNLPGFKQIAQFLGIDTSGVSVDPTASIPGYDKGATEDWPTPGSDTSGSSAFGNVYNFYGPVYVRTEADLEMFCPSPHPLVAATGNVLSTSGIG